MERDLADAKTWLVRHHAFALSDEDLNGIEYVYRVFYEGGTELNYSFPTGGFGCGMTFPTYADLMTEADGGGERRSYLASEERLEF